MVVGIVVALVIGNALVWPDPFYDRVLYHGVAFIAAVPLGVAAWALHRIMVAWVRWPSRRWLARWSKTVVAFFLIDPQHRHQD